MRVANSNDAMRIEVAQKSILKAHRGYVDIIL